MFPSWKLRHANFPFHHGFRVRVPVSLVLGVDLVRQVAPRVDENNRSAEIMVKGELFIQQKRPKTDDECLFEDTATDTDLLTLFESRSGFDFQSSLSFLRLSGQFSRQRPGGRRRLGCLFSFSVLRFGGGWSAAPLTRFVFFVIVQDKRFINDGKLVWVNLRFKLGPTFHNRLDVVGLLNALTQSHGLVRAFLVNFCQH